MTAEDAIDETMDGGVPRCTAISNPTLFGQLLRHGVMELILDIVHQYRRSSCGLR